MNSEIDYIIKMENIILIGMPGSGKSTIAKIISNCLWMEKEIAVHPNKHNNM